MAMLDGKPHKYGANMQRESFGRKANESGNGKDRTDTKIKTPPAEHGEATTQITHHADGTHTAVHSDGETSEHPHLGHLAMALHSKHLGGDGAHIHAHGGMGGEEGAVTTHHVGADGVVEGPHHHASMDEANSHLASMIGQDGEGGERLEEQGIHEGGADLALAHGDKNRMNLY
jgi:hypothetical protein